MSISFKTENETITAIRDRAMFNTFAGNDSYIISGIGNELECTVTPSTFNVSLGSGEAVICGGSTIVENGNTVTLGANESGYVVIRVDLSQTQENVCKLTKVPTLIQQNINNGTDLIYDMPLYQYVTNTTSITTFTDIRKIKSSSGFDGNYNSLANKPTIPPAVAVKGNAEASYRTGDVNLTPADIGASPSNHVHGKITNNGDITTNVAIANGDRLVINDESANEINNSSITFGTNTKKYLANNGTWQDIPTGQLVQIWTQGANTYPLAQTITNSDIASYSWFVIVCGIQLENITGSSVRTKVFTVPKLLTSADSRFNLKLEGDGNYRTIQFTANNTLKFVDGTNANRLVPMYIYGIKF